MKTWLQKVSLTYTQICEQAPPLPGQGYDVPDVPNPNLYYYFNDEYRNISGHAPEALTFATFREMVLTQFFSDYEYGSDFIVDSLTSLLLTVLDDYLINTFSAAQHNLNPTTIRQLVDYFKGIVGRGPQIPPPNWAITVWGTTRVTAMSNITSVVNAIRQTPVTQIGQTFNLWTSGAVVLGGISFSAFVAGLLTVGATILAIATIIASLWSIVAYMLDPNSESSVDREIPKGMIEKFRRQIENMPQANLVPPPGPWGLQLGVLQGADPTAMTHPGQHPTGGVYDIMDALFDPVSGIFPFPR